MLIPQFQLMLKNNRSIWRSKLAGKVSFDAGAQIVEDVRERVLAEQGQVAQIDLAGTEFGATDVGAAVRVTYGVTEKPMSPPASASGKPKTSTWPCTPAVTPKVSPSIGVRRGAGQGVEAVPVQSEADVVVERRVDAEGGVELDAGDVGYADARDREGHVIVEQVDVAGGLPGNQADVLPLEELIDRGRRHVDRERASRQGVGAVEVREAGRAGTGGWGGTCPTPSTGRSTRRSAAAAGSAVLDSGPRTGMPSPSEKSDDPRELSRDDGRRLLQAEFGDCGAPCLDTFAEGAATTGCPAGRSNCVIEADVELCRPVDVRPG